MIADRLWLAVIFAAVTIPVAVDAQGFQQSPVGGGRKDFPPSTTGQDTPQPASPFGQQSGTGGQPSFGGQPAFGGQPPSGGQQPYGGQPQFGGQTPFGAQQLPGGPQGGPSQGYAPGGNAPQLGFNPPQQQPRPAPNGQSDRPNFADELTDFGIPPQTTMRRDVAAPTPMSIPGGHLITTREVMQTRGMQVVLLDVLEGQPHPEIPGAVWLPGAGTAGSFDDQYSHALWDMLSQATQRNPNFPIVVFCEGARCWESYNAALRIIQLGFKTVLWYRGGVGVLAGCGAANDAARWRSGPATRRRLWISSATLRVIVATPVFIWQTPETAQRRCARPA